MGSPGASFLGRVRKFLCTSPLVVQAEGRSNQLVTLFSASPKWAYEINVRHLQQVLQSIPEQTRLIYVSSDHVFGGDGAYDECSTPCPISVYGRTRVEAERLVLERPKSLVIRTGLAIGPSPNGRTGHLDWLRYRTQHQLPITIVEDEFRSVVWAEDLAVRVMDLANCQETGVRQIAATRAISRVELAQYLLKPDLHSEQKRIIEESFQYICSHNSSKTEAFDFKSSYIKVSLLVSMDIAVGSVIEESIQLVNEKISCLCDGYFVTNVNQPTEKDIQNYLTDLWEKG